MKRIYIVVVLALACCALTLPASATCSNATLKGAYGSQESQQGYDANWSMMGLLTFDGSGNGYRLWEAFQRSDGYADFSAQSPITYTVASDCTFTMHLDPLIFTGVIVDNGKQIKYVEITGTQFRWGNANKVSSQTQQQ